MLHQLPEDVSVMACTHKPPPHCFVCKSIVTEVLARSSLRNRLRNEPLRPRKPCACSSRLAPLSVCIPHSSGEQWQWLGGLPSTPQDSLHLPARTCGLFSCWRVFFFSAVLPLSVVYQIQYKRDQFLDKCTLCSYCSQGLLSLLPLSPNGKDCLSSL